MTTTSFLLPLHLLRKKSSVQSSAQRSLSFLPATAQVNDAWDDGAEANDDDDESFSEKKSCFEPGEFVPGSPLARTHLLPCVPYGDCHCVRHKEEEEGREGKGREGREDESSSDLVPPAARSRAERVSERCLFHFVGEGEGAGGWEGEGGDRRGHYYYYYE